MKALFFSILLAIVTVGLFIFSYLWIDLGLLLMISHTHSILNNFFPLLRFGNNNRLSLAWVYLTLSTMLFVLQLSLLSGWFSRVKFRVLLITFGITTLVFSLSYNFLSHDIFTYLFFSKVAWYYHLNPYSEVPKNFMRDDLWLSFVHSVDGTYRYGLLYLVYLMIPMSIFTASRFILLFFGLKLMNAIVFFLCGVLLLKLSRYDRRVFSFWFLNPFLIIELLINAHNDLLMICGFFISMFFLMRGQTVKSGLSFMLTLFTKSANIITNPSIFGLPMFFLNEKNRAIFFKFVSLAIFIYLQITPRAVLSWYYSWAYMFLPFAKLKTETWILVEIIGFLLLVGYYPFIRYGNWDNSPLGFVIQALIILCVLSAILFEFNLPERKLLSNK